MEATLAAEGLVDGGNASVVVTTKFVYAPVVCAAGNAHAERKSVRRGTAPTWRSGIR